MEENTIGLALTGVISFIILTSILWGIKRGLKKTIFRFCWLALTVVILILTINPISNWLNSFDLSGLNLNIGGKISKLSDIGVNLLKSMGITEEVLADSPALESLAQNLPTMILNVVLFVLLFWLSKAILWPVWSLISGAIFDKQARKEKKAKKEERKRQKELSKTGNIDVPKQENIPQVITIKENKFRGWGAIFGLVMGLLVCAVTFSPIAGLNSLFQTAYNNITIEEDGKQVPYLSTVMDTKTLQIINSYQNSTGRKVLSYTGMDALSSGVFNGLSNVEVDNQKVYLKNEVDTFISIYKDVVTLQNIDMQNLTKQSIDKILTIAEKILVNTEGSKILYLVGDELIPYFVDEFLDQEDITIIDGDVIDEVLISAYKSSVDFALKEFRNEILAVIDIATELNNADILAPIINEEVSTLDQLARLVGTNVKDSNKFSKNIVDSIYNINMLEGEYATIVKASIEAIFNFLGVSYQEQDLTAQSVKNGLQTILKNAVNICQVYAKSGSTNLDENTSIMLSSAGAILDYVKGDMLSEQNYNSLIVYLKNSLTDVSAGLGDFSSIFSNLNSITSWETELKSLSKFCSAVIEISESGLTIEDISNGKTDAIKKLGKGLKSAVNTSKIINNNNIRVAIEEILKTHSLGVEVDDLLDINVDSGITLKNHILNNVYNNGVTSIKDWEKELEYGVNLFVDIYNLVNDGFDINELSKDDNAKLEEVGTSIDGALENTNLVVSHKVIRAILEDLLNNTQDLGVEVEEILLFKDNKGVSVLNNILNNIYSGENKDISFAKELKTIIKTVSNILELDISNIDKDNILLIGRVLDTLSQSKIVNKHVIATILSNYTDKLTSTMDANLGAKIQPFVEGIKQNFEKVDSYEAELQNLVDLLNIAESGNLNLTEVGLKLDSILSNSQLIEKDNVVDLIEGLFDEFISITDEDLNSAVSSIKTNVLNATSFEDCFKELSNVAVYLQDFSNLETIDQFKAANTDSALGKALDDIASMTAACDESIAYGIAKDLIEGLKTNNPDIATSVDNIINSEPYNFSEYETSGNYPESISYYTTLINAIFGAL